MLTLPRSAAVLVLLAAILFSAELWRNASVAVTDFTAFWIAGHRVLNRGNPYDSHYALEAERSMGFMEPKALVMRNPPWALWLTVPLGLLRYTSARLLWTLFLVISLWLSAELLWRIYGTSPGPRWAALLLTFCFAPTVACLSAGQISPIVLLGLTLFLYLHARHEFWAGFSLSIAAFKPQVAFLFWVVLLLWAVQCRKWRLIAGTILGIAFATAIALFLDPRVLTHYRSMMLAESIGTQFIPTFGGFLRQLFGPPWLQIAPAIAGLCWSFGYYYQHRQRWNWKQSLPVLVLLSLLTTPYAWLGDEVVILIALIGAAAAIRRPGRAVELGIPFAAVNVAIVSMLVVGVRVNGPYYIWSSWIWVILVLCCNRSSRISHIDSPEQSSRDDAASGRKCTNEQA